MEKNKINSIRAILLLIVVEFIVALSISVSPFVSIIRIFGILIAILLFVVYFKQFNKFNKETIIFLILCLMFGLSILPYGMKQNETLDLVSLFLSYVSAGWIGLTVAKDENLKNKPLYAIYGSLIFFGGISVFVTLFQYGFFYGFNESSVSSSSKVLILSFDIFSKGSRTSIALYGYLLSLLSSGIVVVLLKKANDIKDFKLKRLMLCSGILGVVGLILVPYLLGIVVVLLSVGITALIIYFPKDKKKRTIIYCGIITFALLAIILIAIKGRNIARVKTILDVLCNSIKYPLGNQPLEVLNGTPNTRNIYFDALYQNGIPSFLILIAITILAIIIVNKYLKNSNDSKLVKYGILSYLIHYFIYVNLNYTQSIFVEDSVNLPLFMEPTLLIVFILIGYMITKSEIRNLEVKEG